MESSTLRLSYVDNITDIRKKLWETAYSNFECNNILAKCLYNAFNGVDPYPINQIGFNFGDLKISIDLCRPVSNIEMNTILTVAFENFVDEIYNIGNLNSNEYEVCKSRANMLFSLILNTETKAEITL